MNHRRLPTPILAALMTASALATAWAPCEEPKEPLAEVVGRAEKLWGRGLWPQAAEAFVKAAERAAADAAEMRRAGKEPPWRLWAEVEVSSALAAELASGHAVSAKVADALDAVLRSDPPPCLAARLRWIQAELILSQGDIKRSTKTASALGFLVDWQVIGPFDNERGAGFDAVYGPESEPGATDLDAKYEGKKRHEVAWRRVPARSPWGYVDLDQMLRPNDECLAYAVTFVRSGETCDAALRLSSDDGVKAWLNDRLVLSRDVRRPCTFDQDVVGVRLERGWNKLIVKVAEQKLDWGFRARLTRPDGAPLRGVSERADAAQRYAPAEGDAPQAADMPDTIAALESELAGAVATSDGRAIQFHPEMDGFRDALAKIPGVKPPPATERPEAAAAALEEIAATKSLKEWTDACGAYVTAPDTAAVARGFYLLGELRRYRMAHDVEKHPDRDAFAKAVAYAPQSALYRFAFASVATDRAQMAAERDENRARTALEQALVQDPACAAAAAALGWYYLRNFGNTVKSLEYCERALATSPDCLQAKLLRAGVMRERGWDAEYELAVRSAAQGDAPGAEALRALGDLEHSRGRLQAAAEAYEKALALTFDDPGGSLRKALAGAYLGAGKLYKALDLYAQAIELNPFDAEARHERAKLLAAADELPAAIEQCRTALETAPEDHEMLADLGHYLARAGKKQEASEQWRKALAIQPNFARLDRYVRFVEGKTAALGDRRPEDVSKLLEEAKSLKSDANDPAYVVLNKVVERVYRDGTSSRGVHQLIKILTTTGADRFASQRIGYIVGEQSIEIKVARVHRADGRVDEAERDAARPGGDELAEEADFPQYAAAGIRMPPLRVGDVIEVQYRVDDTRQGFFGDYFGSIQRFGLPVPVMKAKYILIVPKERAVHTHLAVGAKGPDSEEDAELGATVYTWQAENVAKLEIEPFMPDARELLPTVYLSTYRDWKDFGAWYWKLIEDQYKVNDEMREKVAALTAGRATEYEKIRAIYDFVVTDIRYVAWEFGVHGFKPYRATQIFDRKFGDCKDKATLMNALLGCAGIKAYPVLIRAEGRRSREFLQLPMIQHFNHCISYVPAGKDHPEMFLDGTAIYHSIDTIPWMDEGATVCVVKPGGAELKTVPASKAEANSTVEVIQATLKLSGEGERASCEATASVESGFNGSRAVVVRQHFSIPDRRKLLLDRIYGGHYAGSQCVEPPQFSDLANIEEPVTAKYTVTIPNFASREGREWKLRPVKGLLRGLLGLMCPDKLSDLAPSAKRTSDVVLVQAWSHDSSQTITLPAGLKVTSVPEPVRLSNKFGRLTIEYKVEGSALKVKKFIAVDAVRIPAAEYPEFRRFCNEVDEAERRDIILGSAD